MKSTANPYRHILFPPEHGSWGFVLEPILLGLLVAPTLAGGMLALGSFAAFLLRWPFKVWLQSRARQRAKRAALAQRVVFGYGVLLVVGFGAAISLGGWSPLLPLLFAAPFAAVFAYYDFRNESRSWQAEVCGTAAFAFVAPVIVLAGGWELGLSLALWPLLVARAWPSVVYVRERIKLEKGWEFRPKLPILLHILALIIAAIIMRTASFAPIMLLIYLLLLIRAAWGLSPYRRSNAIKVVGISELIWGLLLVITLAFGV